MTARYLDTMEKAADTWKHYFTILAIKQDIEIKICFVSGCKLS